MLKLPPFKLRSCGVPHLKIYYITFLSPLLRNLLKHRGILCGVVHEILPFFNLFFGGFGLLVEFVDVKIVVCKKKLLNKLDFWFIFLGKLCCFLEVYIFTYVLFMNVLCM